MHRPGTRARPRRTLVALVRATAGMEAAPGGGELGLRRRAIAAGVTGQPHCPGRWRAGGSGAGAAGQHRDSGRREQPGQQAGDRADERKFGGRNGSELQLDEPGFGSVARRWRAGVAAPELPGSERAVFAPRNSHDRLRRDQRLRRSSDRLEFEPEPGLDSRPGGSDTQFTPMPEWPVPGPNWPFPDGSSPPADGAGHPPKDDAVGGGRSPGGDVTGWAGWTASSNPAAGSGAGPRSGVSSSFVQTPAKTADPSPLPLVPLPLPPLPSPTAGGGLFSPAGLVLGAIATLALYLASLGLLLGRLGLASAPWRHQAYLSPLQRPG